MRRAFLATVIVECDEKVDHKTGTLIDIAMNNTGSIKQALHTAMRNHFRQHARGIPETGVWFSVIIGDIHS